MKTVINMPRYSVYKDSGVDWLGDVPEAWHIKRLGSYFIERRTKVSDKDYPALSVTKMGILSQLENAAKTNDGDNRKLVKKGDFVINSRSDRKGSSGVSNLDGSVSLINIVLQPKFINPQFTNYLLKNYSFVEEFYRIGHGIVADLWTTRYEDMKNIFLSIPSQKEQITIVDFLDKKTTQIDQAISIKQKQIELLKERQQIIIQQAVTKGLDPNVPMKDSGIEWIGMIPKHWEIKKLKYVLQLTNKKQLSLNSELLYIGMENIESGTGEFIETNSETEGLANYFEANQLLFGKLRPYLAKVYKTRTIGLCSTEFLVYKCPDNLCIDFYHCFLISPEFIKVINASTYGSKMPRANSDFIGNQMILVPPLKEQIEINQYVNKNKNNIKQLIIIYQQQIEKLKEYKTTLIDSAVTGKIKITSEE